MEPVKPFVPPLALGRRAKAAPWLLLASAVVCGLLSGCRKKPEPAVATTHFFEQIAAGDTHGAYGNASFAFKAQQTEAVFAQTVREMGLSGPIAVVCSPPEMRDREIKLKVAISTAEKKDLPFVVSLVDEAGEWRVFALRTPRPDAAGRSENRFSLVGRGAGFSNALSQPAPDEKEIKRLVSRAIESFGEALESRSFADFYQSVSASWQKQLTLNQLSRAFQPFIDNHVSLSGVKDAEMKLDGPPTVNTDGLLVVNGHFTTAPYQVFFNLKFVYELPSWKLFGIDVNLQR